MEWQKQLFRKEIPASSLPPPTTLADAKTAIDGMISLINEGNRIDMYLKPHRMSQDVVENWFGYQRQACGSNRNMTGKYEQTEQKLLTIIISVADYRTLY